MIYEKVPGGPQLLAWFGREPSFHDAEIISLCLNRTGTSELKIHGWITSNKTDANGYLVHEKQAIVTFKLEGVMDLQLDGFSSQNVIHGLAVRHAIDRGRANYLAMEAEPDDIEIELLPCYGLDGFIRMRKLAISFVPGRPDEASREVEG